MQRKRGKQIRFIFYAVIEEERMVVHTISNKLQKPIIRLSKKNRNNKIEVHFPLTVIILTYVGM